MGAQLKATLAIVTHGELVLGPLVACALEVAERAGRESVVLTGAVFRTSFCSGVGPKRSRRGHRVLSGQIPCNDGGIAAGQASIAARFAQCPGAARICLFGTLFLES
jgi:hydrogenase maturation factor HypF (carbamoyltransferase family)